MDFALFHEYAGKEISMTLKIWTSFFGNYGISKDPRAVSIANWTPFKNVRTYPALAPSKHLLSQYRSGNWTVNKTLAEYRKQVLGPLNPLDVFMDLNRMAVNNEVVILCWCHDRRWCHRTQVANWLKRAFKDDDVVLFEIKELPVHPKTKHRSEKRGGASARLSV